MTAARISVLGIDPGFASIGYSIGLITSKSVIVRHMGTFRTKKDNSKKKILVADDNIRRTREIAEWLAQTIESWNVKIICAESMSHPRNSSAASKMALC